MREIHTTVSDRCYYINLLSAFKTIIKMMDPQSLFQINFYQRPGSHAKTSSHSCMARSRSREGRAAHSWFKAAPPHASPRLQQKKLEPSSLPSRDGPPTEPDRTGSRGGAQVTITAWTGRSRDSAARSELLAEEVTLGPWERLGGGPGSQALVGGRAAEGA